MILNVFQPEKYLELEIEVEGGRKYKFEERKDIFIGSYRFLPRFTQIDFKRCTITLKPSYGFPDS